MKLIKELVWGKSNLFNGIIGLAVVCAIALGCNCSKDFSLNTNTGNTDTNKTVFNTDSTPVPTSDDSKLSDTPRGDVPSEKDMEELVKESLLDFNDAVAKGDFTDFYDGISKVWKKQTSPEKFNQGFSEFIEKKVDISTIKNKIADFDPEPTVSKKNGVKVLEAKGKYETTPLPTRFEMEYLQEGGDWKLISIRVDTRK